MEVALPVIFAILGMLEIGHALATSAPPEWALGELLLLAACFVVVRECKRLWDDAEEDRRSKEALAGAAEKFARSPDFEPLVVHPVAGGAGRGEICASHSVEQIAHAMVTLAFRNLSLRYHPDQGGDPEVMRRVYAAREMILRALRKG